MNFKLWIIIGAVLLIMVLVCVKKIKNKRINTLRKIKLKQNCYDKGPFIHVLIHSYMYNAEKKDSERLAERVLRVIDSSSCPKNIRVSILFEQNTFSPYETFMKKFEELHKSIKGISYIENLECIIFNMGTNRTTMGSLKAYKKIMTGKQYL